MTNRNNNAFVVSLAKNNTWILYTYPGTMLLKATWCCWLNMILTLYFFYVLSHCDNLFHQTGNIMWGLLGLCKINTSLNICNRANDDGHWLYHLNQLYIVTSYYGRVHTEISVSKTMIQEGHYFTQSSKILHLLEYNSQYNSH